MQEKMHIYDIIDYNAKLAGLLRLWDNELKASYPSTQNFILHKN